MISSRPSPPASFATFFPIPLILLKMRFAMFSVDSLVAFSKASLAISSVISVATSPPPRYLNTGSAIFSTVCSHAALPIAIAALFSTGTLGSSFDKRENSLPARDIMFTAARTGFLAARVVIDDSPVVARPFCNALPILPSKIRSMNPLSGSGSPSSLSLSAMPLSLSDALVKGLLGSCLCSS